MGSKMGLDNFNDWGDVVRLDEAQWESGQALFCKNNAEEIAAHGKSRNWFMGGRAKTAHVVGTPQYPFT